MSNHFHDQNFFTRYSYYNQLSGTGVDARNYNIQVQRILAVAEHEKSWFLRYFVYNTMQTAVLLFPKRLKAETLTAFIHLLAKEQSIYLRGVNFKVMGLRFTGVGEAIYGDKFKTPLVRKALQDALYVEEQGLKPFAQGSYQWRKRNVVAGYIHGILAAFDKPQPPSADRKRTRRPDRRRGGPV